MGDEVENQIRGYEYPSLAEKGKRAVQLNDLLHYKDHTKDGQLQLNQVSEYLHECSQTNN